MYRFVTMVPRGELVREHVPVAALSLVIAELFYKFHSFTLECLAFLATWYAIDGVSRLIRSGRSSH